MKSVLISIQPKWCEKIANEEKKVEVRKTAPKCVPFKAYIYCTNTPQLHHLYDLRHVNGGAGKIRLGCVQHNKYSLVAGGWLNGKVIGEFIVDNVIEFESEFHDDNSTEELRRVWYDEDEITLNGTKYDAESFRRIADHLTVDQVAKVANRLLQRKGEIQNREKYIQCMLAECFGIGEECK